MDLESQRIFRELFKTIKEDSQDKLIGAIIEAGVLIAVLGPLESLMHWYMSVPRPTFDASGTFAAISLLTGFTLIIAGYLWSSAKEK
jgi:hypothetical protein